MTIPRKNSERRKAGRSPRETIWLKEDVRKRLSNYALAAEAALQDALANPHSNRWVLAGAAGLGMLALAAPANAEIVQGNAFEINCAGGSSPHTVSAHWDVNGDGITDFVGEAKCKDRFSPFFLSHFFSGSGAIRGQGLIGGPLKAGDRIGSGDRFGDRAGHAYGFGGTSLFGSAFLKTGGSWANRSGFLGFRFQIDGQFHYGWADLSVTTSSAAHRAGFYSAQTSEVFYDSVPNQAILAGQTTVIPEPGTLSLLALGSLGLGFWRRKKQPAGKE